MSQILVDSSVWISFFKGSIDQDPFFTLIDTNQLCINDLILSEIVPSLLFKKEEKIFPSRIKKLFFLLKKTPKTPQLYPPPPLGGGARGCPRRTHYILR